MNEVNDNNKREFNASIEQLIETDETIELVLDGIETSIIDEINDLSVTTDNMAIIYERILSVNTNIFTLTLRKDEYPEYELFTEDSWVSFNISYYQTDTEISLYNSQFFNSEPEILYIEDIKPIDISAKTKIFSMNIFKQLELEEIRDLIQDKLPGYIENVFVYNVGQGNCNAITNYRCLPCIFYDFGGGAYQNTNTYPGNVLNQDKIEFDFSEEPLVILSHWDWDHMVSILKSEHADIKKSSWIVPKQQIGISHLKVAVELYNSGKLIVWPDDKNELTVMDLHIQKLSGDDKNNSGLVLTVCLNQHLSEAVLLPGDANYNLIKKLEYPYYGLVATHHGASSHNCLVDMPKPYIDSHKIAFSFGKNNSYNHPKINSLYQHDLNGWTNRFFTVNGHIYFGYHSYYPHHFPYVNRMGRIQ